MNFSTHHWKAAPKEQVFAPPDPSVFAGFIDPAEFETGPRPAPCRVIPVTPEMAARDAAARRAREKRIHDWTFTPSSAASTQPTPCASLKKPLSEALSRTRKTEPADREDDVKQTASSYLSHLPDPVPVAEALDKSPEKNQHISLLREANLERPKCHGGCGRRVRRHTSTGLCYICTKQMRGRRFTTTLNAMSREEHEANQAWAALSLEDRLTLLDMAMGG